MRLSEIPYYCTNKEWYYITDEGIKLTPKGESIKEVRESYEETMKLLEESGMETEFTEDNSAEQE